MTDTHEKSGAFVPTGVIFDQVVELRMEVTRLKTQLSVVGFFITPALSTIVATIVAATMGG